MELNNPKEMIHHIDQENWNNMATINKPMAVIANNIRVLLGDDFAIKNMNKFKTINIINGKNC